MSNFGYDTGNADNVKGYIPIIPNTRLMEIIRGFIASESTADTRPDMNNEHNLLRVAKIIVDEAYARLPLWELECMEAEAQRVPSVKFSAYVYGSRVMFSVEQQSFALDYETEDAAELYWMRDMLEKALTKLSAAQEPVQQEAEAQRVLASTWFALVMNAAACLEDASNCLTDADARKSAIGAAKHYRDAANSLFSAAPVQQEAKPECDRCGDPPEQHTDTHWCDNQSFRIPQEAKPEKAQPVLTLYGNYSFVKEAGMTDEIMKQIEERGTLTLWGPPLAPPTEAKQEAKPVAWVYTINKSHSVFSAEKPPEDAYDEGTLFPLYDAPPTESAIRNKALEDAAKYAKEMGWPLMYEEALRAMKEEQK